MGLLALASRYGSGGAVTAICLPACYTALRSLVVPCLVLSILLLSVLSCICDSYRVLSRLSARPSRPGAGPGPSPGPGPSLGPRTYFFQKNVRIGFAMDPYGLRWVHIRTGRHFQRLLTPKTAMEGPKIQKESHIGILPIKETKAHYNVHQYAI